MNRSSEIYKIIPSAQQTVAYTGTAGNSTALSSSKTGVVRVMTTTAAIVAIGPSAVASATNGVAMAANVPEYFLYNEGDRVSAIQIASGGNLHVTPVTK